ncbi:uncharacterized protein LOC122245120 [Penaeus japonicus]|uniref:uncharacterized protein LOC122245120 n=1 Tax=Penaeus japonicus TaxID=27405 RepID=UPI001C715DDE|nr:uncharacterized protein LOC122245120 [Penaeus japonicus]
MDSFLRELNVPWWTAEYLAYTNGWSSANLASGAYGTTKLVSNGRQSLVVKNMIKNREISFMRELKALSKVKGIEGLQRVEAVIVEDEKCIIVSHYAGDTLKTCVERKLLSSAQLVDALHQVRCALVRMHEAGVAHFDIHEENVCVAVGKKRVQATIIDLGIACFEDEPEFEWFKQTDIKDYYTLVSDMRNLLLKNSACHKNDEYDLDREVRLSSNDFKSALAKGIKFDRNEEANEDGDDLCWGPVKSDEDDLCWSSVEPDEDEDDLCCRSVEPDEDEDDLCCRSVKPDEDEDDLCWSSVKPDEDDDDLCWSSVKPDEDEDDLCWSSVEPDEDEDDLCWSSVKPDEDDDDLCWSSVEPDEDEDDLCWSSVEPDEDEDDLCWSSVKPDEDEDDLCWSSVEPDEDEDDLCWSSVKPDEDEDDLCCRSEEPDEDEDDLCCRSEEPDEEELGQIQH